VVRAHRLMVAYAAAMLAFASLYFALPPRWLWYSVMVLISAGAVIVGLVRYRPRRRLPWVLLAGAVLMQASGDVTATYMYEVLGQADPFPSPADAFYLVGAYPLLIAVMLRLLRSGAPQRDRASVLDALILTAGVGLLFWIFFVGPVLASPELGPAEKAIAAAYPVFDVLVLTLLIRMSTAFGRLRPAVALVLIAVLSLLVGDVAYSTIQIMGTFTPFGVLDLPWVAFYLAAGAAALHPSMVELTEPRVLRTTQVSRRRVTLIGLASLIPPTVLLVEGLRGPVGDNAIVIAVMCMALFGLVVTRFADLVGAHRRGLAREAALRHAGAALLAAGDSAQVTAVIRAAVAELLPPGTDHRVAVRIAAAEEVDAGAGLSVLRMVYTRAIDDHSVAAELAAFEVALCCPLDGRRITGMLWVAADEGSLVGLQEAAQILASQAALASEGVAANAENARRESEAYFRTLVLSAADVIVILDDDERVRYASPSVTALFGPAPVQGVPLTNLVEPEERAAATATLAAVRAGEGTDGLVDWTMRRGTEQVNVEVSCRDLRADRTVGGLVVTLRDVTERRRLERELLRRAYYDPLTGLPNRSLFADRVERASAAAAEVGTTAGVLIVGLDDFKQVNDTMGHDRGDDLLVAAGQRLVALFHPRHDVARLGGDEFAVLVGSAAGPEDVEPLAQRVVTAFAEPFPLGDTVVTSHVSVGVATTADAGDAQQLLSQADIALAMAKSTGKDRWRRYESGLHTRILERLQLRRNLDRAIADGEFFLAFQPVVDLRTRRAQGLEALVRWQHPTRGMMPPLEFIDVAEESGLIVPLGTWVLRTALATAREWERLRPSDPPYVSVNVSARQFRAPGFVETVRRELAESGLPPQSLCLEITESLLLADDRQVWADLTALRDAGIQVAIDDFGTGYSSLSYLHKVPMDIVKLDKSFVDTISTSGQQLDLVGGIVQLAHTLGLQVVAEGIETSTDRALLLRTGCEFGQGYLFARPMSQDDAVQWLLDQSQPADATQAAAAA
jgi:diguanylate cyclase (GGDEF)-like protein/PAS domain S-box-containing protein